VLGAPLPFMTRLATASVDEPGAMPGPGPTIAESVAKYLAEAENERRLDRLAEVEVRMVEGRAGHGTGALLGQTVAFTGRLSGLTRQAAGARVPGATGRMADTVSQQTDHLVVGEAPGAKAPEAGRPGVRMLDQAAFRGLVQRLSTRETRR